MNELLHYFPELTDIQRTLYAQLLPLYEKWNEKINVVSRKNFENFYIQHVLHSLSIAKFIRFKPGTVVLDLGTGGGFPSVPLAIFFPDVKFIAVDSIEKKIKVVQGVVDELELANVTPIVSRVEQLDREVDFVVSRAVAPMEKLIRWTRPMIHTVSFNDKKNGWIVLKGGDLKDELKDTRRKCKITPISNYFSEPFFETKYIVYT